MLLWLVHGQLCCHPFCKCWNKHRLKESFAVLMSWRICPILPLSLPVFKDWMRERESDPKIAWEISISVANMTPLLQRKGLRGFCCVGRREDFIHCSYCFAKTVPDYHPDTRVLTLKKPGGGAFHLVMGGA